MSKPDKIFIYEELDSEMNPMIVFRCAFMPSENTTEYIRADLAHGTIIVNRRESERRNKPLSDRRRKDKQRLRERRSDEFQT